MTKADEDHDVTIQFRAPTFREGESANDPLPQSQTGLDPRSHLGLKSQSRSDEDSQRIRDHRRSTGSVHLGSYASSIEIDRGSYHGSIRNLQSRNASQAQLEHLLANVDAVDSYGLQESRDGFFDATFQSPLRADHEETLRKASQTLPETMRKPHSVSLYHFLPQQFAEAKAFLTDITTTRSGIKLFKSFLGVFVAYIVCLVPDTRDWLGRYNYIIVISAILNHPGRPLGSQIDGAMISTIGTAAGLAWGSLALYVSTSTPMAQSGYGGVLASFLILFTAIIAWLRCTFIRLFQAVICAGVAICYTCLADTSQAVGWKKIFNYGIPWVLGQTLGLLISIFVFPDAGSRSLALSFHQAFLSILKGLELPRKDASELKRELSYHFVRLSTAVRDFTIDISVSRFEPDDIRVMRNLTQGVIRALLSIQSDTILFNIQVNPLAEGLRDGKLQDQPRDLSVEDEKRLIVTLVADFLTKPTRKMLDAMTACLDSCDSVMLTIGGQQKLQVSNNPQSLSMCLQVLQKSVEGFDAADDALVDRPEMVSGSGYQEVVKLFLFVHPIRQAADKIRMLTRHIYAMEQKHRGWWLQLPSYPYKKSLNRTNAQVRHDRGGLTAGFYFRTKTQLEKTIEELHSRSYVPAARHEVGQSKQKSSQAGETTGAAMNSKVNKAKKQGLRYRIWVALHRLQGFESRFAFKVVVVTTLLSVPAWLDQSRGWWNDNEIWWAVVTVWLMTHPRVSGTSHDLAVRIFYVLLGSVWGALSYRAGSGNPYVVAIFAAVFMIPMLHRYTQSAHPRSGVIGCISFTVISLSTYTSGGNPSVTQIAWTRGLAFAAATLASVLVNWILWPFVARHELRKSISAMMLHLAILYRGVVSRYVYYSKDDEPGPQDIARSEMLEGRLREGFVRIRQLMELTQHEIRLRAPFDPLPYSALIDASAQLFENLIEVRQSSLYFRPSYPSGDDRIHDSLTPFRRDAVAVILMNLFILACSLRATQPIPRYLPSAAAARQKLLDQMERVEAELVARQESKLRRWADVYRYAFSSALTDIVAQLQELQKYTREIVGESAYVAGNLAPVND